MKNEKVQAVYEPKKPNNVFAKILDDHRRIQEAISKGRPLSTLKDINFVKPNSVVKLVKPM